MALGNDYFIKDRLRILFQSKKELTNQLIDIIDRKASREVYVSIEKAYSDAIEFEVKCLFEALSLRER